MEMNQDRKFNVKQYLQFAVRIVDSGRTLGF